MIQKLMCAAALLAGAGTLACADPAPPAVAQETRAAGAPVWQMTPFALLVRGHYDGVLPVAEVKRHGNLGLGAADQLNGEMALVDGRFYQFLENGRAVEAPETMRMPFAEVTAWDGGTSIRVQAGLEYGSTFNTAVDARLPTTNAFYAVRMEGTWDVVTARTYKMQTRPYPPLGQAAADTFAFTAVEGTMVGFRQPSYADSLGVPDYHLHFITRDRQRGGHVLGFTTRDVRMVVSERADFTLRMPPNPPQTSAP